ncbi:hypothetical protein [Cohnella phaseoli]|uniref:Oxidoreductase family protein n=1 Tax=Cohnella phaseoli TaxID=456490 RepID=A0A3D9JTZ1_9BACL|nr:hypothetical protein [Cohnella phaseoli]RED76916.1 hypothetical protein DFP98_110137 [Cohnella phaseoli]
MVRKLKVGILGAGGIFEAHASGFSRLRDRCEVVVADTNVDGHPRIRKQLGNEMEIVSDYRMEGSA